MNSKTNSYFQRLKQDGTIARFSAIIRHKEEVSVAFDDMSESDSFYGGSFAKLFSGLLCAKWLSEGKISLLEPVGKYIGSFSQGELRTILIIDLLTHTAGLTPDPGALGEAVPRPEKKIRSQKIDFDLAAGEPLLKPRMQFSYSSLGFIVFSRIVEKIASEPIANVLKNEIFEPLGLVSTGFYQSEKDKGKLNFIKDRELISLNEHLKENTLSYTHGSGGLYTTISDMQRVADYLLGKLPSTSLNQNIRALFMRPYIKGLKGNDWGVVCNSMDFGLGVYYGSRETTGENTICQECGARGLFVVDFDREISLVGVFPIITFDDGKYMAKIINSTWLNL